MAFTILNPVTALWQRRGLSCLLMPKGFNSFAGQQAADARVVSAKPMPAGPSPTRPRPTQYPRKAQENVRGRRGAEQADSDQRPAVSPGPAAVAKHPENTKSSGSEPWRPLPSHVWPSPWRARLEQTRPGPVLWTYWNLGPDLYDSQTQGRMDRRNFLQRLLQDLGHPAGTHTFWPACLPSDNTPQPLQSAAPVTEKNGYVSNPDIFWSGAQQLKARGIVVMGSAAASALDLPAGLRPPQQIRHRGHLVWILWDVENLLRFDQRYASMLAFLRQAMLPLLR